MNKEKTLQLQTQFPGLLRDLYGDVRKTCLAFGIQCDDGWFNLIQETLAAIAVADPNATINQIKEKFGGLRIYLSSSSDIAYDHADKAEARSAFICEHCGWVSPTKLTKAVNGWLITLCPTCLFEHTNRINLISTIKLPALTVKTFRFRYPNSTTR